MNYKPPTTKELRDFGLLTGALFALLFGLIFPWSRGYRFPLWPWILCVLLLGTALLRPQLLKPVFSAWSRLGLVLGWINSRVVLTVIFYVVILPVGLVMRLFGRDAMVRGFDPDATTYRVPTSSSSVESMEKPF